jgi:ATP-binding cassette subfamily F protein uup
VRDFPGNYTLYREYQLSKEKPELVSRNASVPVATKAEKQTPEKRKFSFKEKREFELLQKEIETLSTEKETINQKLSSAAIPFEELQQLSTRIVELTTLLDEKELRWLELSEFAE